MKSRTYAFAEEVSALSSIGSMPMPAGFRYREIFRRGRPRHTKTDPFRIRHPAMDIGKRAKIFAPFDALRGFGDAVAAKNELYESRRELNDEDRAKLDRRMNILCRLTRTGRLVREHPVRISVTYYVPCADEHSEAFGVRGRYQTVTGVCEKADPYVSRSILVGRTWIRFEDIYRINLLMTRHTEP